MFRTWLDEEIAAKTVRKGIPRAVGDEEKTSAKSSIADEFMDFNQEERKRLF